MTYRVTEKSLEDYLPDPDNANDGTERGLQMIEDSIGEVGMGRSLVADRNGILIAGNKTSEAATERGLLKVVEVETGGDVIIVHKRRDWDIADTKGDNPARRYAYYDNRAGEVSLNWSSRAIAANAASGFRFSGIFTNRELSRFLDDNAYNSDVKNDALEDVDDGFDAQKGDIFAIEGNGDIVHRVIFADFDDASAYERLLRGQEASLVVFSVPKTSDFEAFRAILLENSLADASFYVFLPHAGTILPFSQTIAPYFRILSPIHWVHDTNLASIRQNYKDTAQLCYYMCKTNSNPGVFHADKDETVVWNHAFAGSKDKRPQELLRRLIKNSSESGDGVLDLAGNDFVTLVAANTMGRNARIVVNNSDDLQKGLLWCTQLGMQVKRESTAAGEANDNGKAQMDRI